MECADGFFYTGVRLPCELGGIPVRGSAGRKIKETNNLYNFNTMFTKHSTPRHYEVPLVCIHQISAESGFADSGNYNEYGLHDISGDDVHDQTSDWGF